MGKYIFGMKYCHFHSKLYVFSNKYHVFQKSIFDAFGTS